MPDLIEKLRDGLTRYQADKQKILRDGELTQEAKLKRVEALKAERLAAITQTGDVLWLELESNYNQAHEAIRKARAAASAGWDFSRLNYEAAAVPSMLAGVKDMSEIAAMYDRLVGQADPYCLRAFREHAPELLGKMNLASTDRTNAAALIKTLKRDAAAALTTDQVRRAEEAAASLVDRILAAQRVTKAVCDEFGLGGGVGGFFTNLADLNPLAVWLHYRLQVERQIMPEAGTQQIVIRFLPMPERVRSAVKS